MLPQKKTQKKHTHTHMTVLYINIIYIYCDSHYTGPAGRRIVNIAREPQLHHIHHHVQSGGLEDGRLSLPK